MTNVEGRGRERATSRRAAATVVRETSKQVWCPVSWWPLRAGTSRAPCASCCTGPKLLRLNTTHELSVPQLSPSGIQVRRFSALGPGRGFKFATFHGERARLGRSQRRPRRWPPYTSAIVIAWAGAQSSARGRAERQPGRPRSPLTRMASFRLSVQPRFRKFSSLKSTREFVRRIFSALCRARCGRRARSFCRRDNRDSYVAATGAQNTTAPAGPPDPPDNKPEARIAARRTEGRCLR